ncbi:uncharacterized protein LOC123258406 [Cotesia glomerata]|uniref:uncharacterized protein LOC123258406 n=1 Tax=Cotesia glomerata TaxID=32391 RepID=UPI001D005BAC|nr:uncharacterized protein LOC123258406 [Cotesia glomerata]
MLCVRCRLRVKEYIPPASEEEEIISSQISVESLSISAEICTQGSSLSRTVSNFSDNLCDYNDHSLERFLKIPLIEKDRLYSEKNYGVKKLDESYAALENKFQSQFGIVPESTYRKINQDHCSMIAKVKKLYNAESDKSIKKKLLSILPDSWEVSRIASEFNCSRKMILNLKNDISESENVDLDSGEMTTNTLNPTKVPGNQPLKLDVKKLVIDFYESEENSKQLAGMKDFKSVKDCDGNRTRVQKKLILCNLKELYQSFKAQYNSVAIGFSKFASLRPTYCILAGSSGTHVVCVCTIHQNVKLILESTCVFDILYNCTKTSY